MIFINGELNRVFNRPDSMFVRTTPKEYLFEGVQFCMKPLIGIAAIICKQIAEAKSNTVSTAEDGSLRFALFNYVSTIFFKLSNPVKRLNSN